MRIVENIPPTIDLTLDDDDTCSLPDISASLFTPRNVQNTGDDEDDNSSLPDISSSLFPRRDVQNTLDADTFPDLHRFFTLYNWFEQAPTRQSSHPRPPTLPTPNTRLPKRPRDHSDEDSRGYEESVNKKFSKEICDKLTCSVCLSTIYQPVTGSCGHSFCGRCVIDKVSTCPICREDWGRVQPVKNYLLQSILDD